VCRIGQIVEAGSGDGLTNEIIKESQIREGRWKEGRKGEMAKGRS
jgi:hypothetical protein